MEPYEEALQVVRERRFLIDKYDSWLFDEIEQFLGQRVLEVGCGLGNLLMYLVDRQFVVGIETSPEVVKQATRNLAAFQNVSVLEYSITDPEILELQSMRFDSAISLNVFEHVEDDELAMKHTAKLLEPNAYFTLIVPAHKRLYGTMDRSIGHIRRYNKSLATRKLEKVGFVIVLQKYLNFLGALGWFVNGRILKRKVPPSGQLRIFNHIVPVIKTLEHAFPPPIGISLITVAQRKT